MTEARFGTALFNCCAARAWVVGPRRVPPGQLPRGWTCRSASRRSTSRTAAVQQPRRQRVEPALNPDGSVRDLNGFAVITGTQDGSERQMRFGVRLGW